MIHIALECFQTWQLALFGIGVKDNNPKYQQTSVAADDTDSFCFPSRYLIRYLCVRFLPENNLSSRLVEEWNRPGFRALTRLERSRRMHKIQLNGTKDDWS